MSIMTVHAWIMVVILAGLFALLVWDRFPSWLVFMGALTACMTFQLAPPDALLKGFGNVGVVTVAALFPVAAGMYSTGAITLLSQHVIGQPRTLAVAQLKILPPIAIGSGFLNNTPLVAMMIPIIRDLARTTGLAPSKLLMGISFASILGGTITLIGTSVNLIVAGLTSNAIASGQLHGMKPLSLLAPIRVGLPVSVAGVLFLILIGTRLLPGERQRETAAGARRWYRVEFRIESGADLDGKTLEAAGFAQPTGYRLLSVSRKRRTLPIAPDLRLQGEDHLAMAGPLDGVAALWTTTGLLPAFGNLILAERYRNQLVELVVSPRAPAVGRLVSEVPVPDSPYRAAVVGVSHDGQPPEGPLDQYRVQAGDAGILEVPESFFYENRLETDFVLIKTVSGYEVQRGERAGVALGITGAMMALAAFNVTTMLNAALLATGAMLVTGCLTIRRAWESMDWRTVVTLGAAVGLEPALTQSGLSPVFAHLLSSIGGNSATLALAAVFLATLLATNVIGHAAAAVLMFPVALSVANRLGVSFMPYAIILMVGASCAFINPAGFQTNLMVQEPGGYRFGDYAKVGVPLTVLVAVVTLLIVPVVYGF
jgi:di/tricarboxylate transporter